MKKVRINGSVIEGDESKEEKQKKSNSKHIDRAISERDIDTWAKIIVRKQKGKKWSEKMMIQMSRLSNKSFLPPRKTKKRQKKNKMEEK